jgi:hypothetical protein
MNFEFTTISAFLSGSVITLIIKEVVNQINRKVDFERDLKKITFQKKIDKAEKAVSFYWTYLNKVVELKKSLETMHKVFDDIDNAQQDVGHIGDILDRNAKVLADLDGEKYFDVNGIHLYFDLEDDESWNEEDLGKMIDCAGEMKYNYNNLEYWLQRYDELLSQNSERAEVCWEEMKKVMPAYLTSLKQFIDLIEKNRKAVHALFKKLKAQIHD